MPTREEWADVARVARGLVSVRDWFNETPLGRATMIEATIGMDSFGFYVKFTSKVRNRAPLLITIPCESYEHAVAVAIAFNHPVKGEEK